MVWYTILNFDSQPSFPNVVQLIYNANCCIQWVENIETNYQTGKS